MKKISVRVNEKKWEHFKNRAQVKTNQALIEWLFRRVQILEANNQILRKLNKRPKIVTRIVHVSAWNGNREPGLIVLFKWPT